MKRIILPIAGLGLFAGFLGLLGHSLQVDANQQPKPVVDYSAQLHAEQEAHAADVTRFTTSLHAANEQNKLLSVQRVTACQRLIKSGVIIPECK